MRKQTHSKKKKAANPKRKVAKKAQRQIRGGLATLEYHPTVTFVGSGRDRTIIRSQGVLITQDQTGEFTTTFIGFERPASSGEYPG